MRDEVRDRSRTRALKRGFVPGRRDRDRRSGRRLEEAIDLGTLTVEGVDGPVCQGVAARRPRGWA